MQKKQIKTHSLYMQYIVLRANKKLKNIEKYQGLAMKKNYINVGLIGYGTVGKGVVKIY